MAEPQTSQFVGMPTRQTSTTADAAPPWAPSTVHVLAKPTGAVCNLGCAYCFFLDKELLYPDETFRMSDEELERFIVQLIDAHQDNDVMISWQGGEPTLMGLDFYKRAVALAKEHARPGMRFLHTMQTNGTLLDDEWCAFLAAEGFLIGISIDGPAALHDAHRVDKRGGGTHDKVMRGLRLLQKHRVEYNVLTTVNGINGDYPLEVYRYLRDVAGATWIQFIPVVEREDADGNPADLRGMHASKRSVRPEQYGDFLIAVFDEWARHDVERVYVQTFEAAGGNWAGLGNSGMCVFNETCGTGLALEHNGDLYSCDHYVDREFLMGNIADHTITELLRTPQQYAFGMAKRDTLPQACLDCDVLFACRGECPRNRFLTTPDGEQGLNYLCAGLKAFFHHIDRPVRTLIELQRRGRPASDLMVLLAQYDQNFKQALAAAGRNGPCPCGSGRKAKACHAAPADAPRIGEIEPTGPRPSVHRRSTTGDLG